MTCACEPENHPAFLTYSTSSRWYTCVIGGGWTTNGFWTISLTIWVWSGGYIKIGFWMVWYCFEGIGGGCTNIGLYITSFTVVV